MKRLILIGAVVAAALFAQDEGPEQPVPFSHKHHAGTLGLECKKCHVNPDPGEMMTFPVLTTCMECHAAIKTDSPHIQKIAAAAQAGEQLDWVRVYEVPGFVYFSHRSHLAAGAECAKCHGDVPSRERISLAGDITMAGCMNCHIESGSSIDCAYCHEPLE